MVARPRASRVVSGGQVLDAHVGGRSSVTLTSSRRRASDRILSRIGFARPTDSTAGDSRVTTTSRPLASSPSRSASSTSPASAASIGRRKLASIAIPMPSSNGASASTTRRSVGISGIGRQ